MSWDIIEDTGKTLEKGFDSIKKNPLLLGGVVVGGGLLFFMARRGGSDSMPETYYIKPSSSGTSPQGVQGQDFAELFEGIQESNLALIDEQREQGAALAAAIADIMTDMQEAQEETQEALKSLPVSLDSRSSSRDYRTSDDSRDRSDDDDDNDVFDKLAKNASTWQKEAARVGAVGDDKSTWTSKMLKAHKENEELTKKHGLPSGTKVDYAD